MIWQTQDTVILDGDDDDDDVHDRDTFVICRHVCMYICMYIYIFLFIKAWPITLGNATCRVNLSVHQDASFAVSLYIAQNFF